MKGFFVSTLSGRIIRETVLFIHELWVLINSTWSHCKKIMHDKIHKIFFTEFLISFITNYLLCILYNFPSMIWFNKICHEGGKNKRNNFKK